MQTVLVVGSADDPGRVAEVLQGAGYAVALGTPAGLEVDACRVDAVVLDLAAAPGTVWLDVCRAVRRDARTARLPILTVGSYPHDMPAGLGDYHLPGPYSAGVLTSRIRHLLTANALLTAALAGLGMVVPGTARLR